MLQSGLDLVVRRFALEVEEDDVVLERVLDPALVEALQLLVLGLEGAPSVTPMRRR